MFSQRTPAIHCWLTGDRVFLTLAFTARLVRTHTHTQAAISTTMLGDAPIWQRVKNRETLSTKFSENTGHGRAFCTQFQLRPPDFHASCSLVRWWEQDIDETRSRLLRYDHDLRLQHSVVVMRSCVCNSRWVSMFNQSYAWSHCRTVQYNENTTDNYYLFTNAKNDSINVAM